MNKRNQTTKDLPETSSKPAFLTGKRIYLRPLEMGDLEIFYCWFNLPELRQYVQMPYPVSIGKEREFIEHAIKDTESITLAIVLKQADRLIGDTFISPFDKVHRRASIGIAIGDQDYLSQGYGQEALELMLDYAFNTLNLHRMELSVYAFNQIALKCYEKIGFIVEGRIREAHYHNGRYHDVIQMGLLAAEWRRSKSK